MINDDDDDDDDDDEFEITTNNKQTPSAHNLIYIELSGTYLIGILSPCSSISAYISMYTPL